MSRTDANILREMTMISAEGEARYGADLLGRAIGHATAAETSPTMFYSNLIYEIIGNRTHRVMAFQAAREV